MVHILRRLAVTLVVALMAVTFVAGTTLAQQAANPPAQGSGQTMQSNPPAPAAEQPAKKKAAKKTSKKKAAKKKAEGQTEQKSEQKQ